MTLGSQDIYGGDAAQIAASYGIPPDLFSNLIGYESSWDPYAISSAGAMGLGQLMPKTADALSVNAWDPTENLTGAARLLSYLYDKYSSWPAALSAYNSGSPTSNAGALYAAGVLSGVQPGGTVVGPSLDNSGNPLTSSAAPGASPSGIFAGLWNGITQALNPTAAGPQLAGGAIPSQGQSGRFGPSGNTPMGAGTSTTAGGPSAAQAEAAQNAPGLLASIQWLPPGWTLHNFILYGGTAIVLIGLAYVSFRAVAHATD